MFYKRFLGDKDFTKINEISDLIRERNSLENKEKELQEKLNILLSEMRTRSGKVSLLLMADTINLVFNHVDKRKQKGEIPSEIRKDLIEKILSGHKCICGRPIEAGTDAFDQIISWQRRATETVIEDFMLELWRLLGSVKDHFDDTIHNAETLLQRYAITKNDTEQIRIRIKEISDKIGTSEREDASKLQRHRQKLEQKITILNAERMKKTEELEMLKEEYEHLLSKRKEEECKEGIKNELSKRAALACDTHHALCTVYNEFADEIKQVISHTATEFFQKFIDHQGAETLRQIIVNDDYSLQILDRWGKPFLADISAGQRQIMSISFIAALAKAAAKDANFKMPFFMDTPFGRLSYEHRKNLIKNIPSFAKQWVLLATDTEFRRQEARLLRQTNLWGKFYLLKGKGAGSTVIEPCDIDNAFTYLREVEDEL